MLEQLLKSALVHCRLYKPDVYTHIRTHTRTHRYTYTHMYTCTHIYVCIHICTCVLEGMAEENYSILLTVLICFKHVINTAAKFPTKYYAPVYKVGSSLNSYL